MTIYIGDNDGLTYDYDSTNHTLSISGNGQLYDLDQGIINGTVNVRDIVTCTITGNITRFSGATFMNCSALKSVNIPDTVTWIRGYAFYSCSSLESIDIPLSVEELGTACFGGCSNLETIILRGQPILNNSTFALGSSTYCNVYSNGWAENAFTSSVATGIFTFYTGFPTSYLYMKYHDTKLQVDSAIRDGTGKNIATSLNAKQDKIIMTDNTTYYTLTF